MCLNLYQFPKEKGEGRDVLCGEIYCLGWIIHGQNFVPITFFSVHAQVLLLSVAYCLHFRYTCYASMSWSMCIARC